MVPSGNSQVTGSIKVPATVPGHVHTDLLRVGIIPEPYYRVEDDNFAWIRDDYWSNSLEIQRGFYGIQT